MKEEDNQIEINNETNEDNSRNSNNQNPFNENEHIILNVTNVNMANVVNSPVPVTTSAEQSVNIEIINDGTSPSKLKSFLSIILSPFIKLGKYFQNLISILSDKINIQSSYKYFLIFLALGILFFFFSMFYIPFIFFTPGKLLRLLSLGNIFLMLSFLFHYGSKDFFAFLVDGKRACIMLGHIFLMFFSLFISLFIGGYFLQLMLDVLLGISTALFVLTLIPGGQGGINGIKNMIISPLLLLYTTFKLKIFGDSS